MTPNCKACLWYHRNEIGSICRHPDAATHDRVRGNVYPVLTHIVCALSGTEPPNARKTIKSCDDFGWFEPKPGPWWKFWRGA